MRLEKRMEFALIFSHPHWAGKEQGQVWGAGGGGVREKGVVVGGG